MNTKLNNNILKELHRRFQLLIFGKTLSYIRVKSFLIRILDGFGLLLHSEKEVKYLKDITKLNLHTLLNKVIYSYGVRVLKLI